MAISTHTPLAGRDESSEPYEPTDYISTHTPLAGRDPVRHIEKQERHNFYSHAPCGT